MGVQLSVVVPVFNEEGELAAMAAGLAPGLDAVVGEGSWQFVLVDNGSTDSTPRVIGDIVARWPTSLATRLERPDYGEALATGLWRAEGDWAFIINVDWWDPGFLAWAWSSRGRYDLMLGSKRADHTLNSQGRFRKTLSWGLNTILQLFFGFVGSDTHGQKLLKLAAMRPILESCVMRRGQFDTEFTLRALRAGLWLAEVPVPIVEKRAQRNWMVKKILQNLWDILRLRKIVHAVPFSGSIRYHRWAREDVLAVGPSGRTPPAAGKGSDVPC